MQSMSDTDLLALALKQLDARDFDNEFSGDEVWGEEGGIRFCDFSRHMRGLVCELVANYESGEWSQLKAVMDYAEFECLKIRTSIKPHYHNKSESVIFCPEDGDAGAFEGYFQIESDKGLWLPLYAGQIMQIPRGTPHGFRRSTTEQDYELSLVVVTLGKITDEDTIYI